MFNGYYQGLKQINDYFFKCIFLNENFYISILMSLKIVPKGPTDNM